MLIRDLDLLDIMRELVMIVKHLQLLTLAPRICKRLVISRFVRFLSRKFAPQLYVSVDTDTRL